jgi:dUTP pyrophosphatase
MNYILIILGIWVYFRYFGPLLITFKKTSTNAITPTRAYGKAACWDVYALENKSIPTGQWREVKVGISFAPWPHIYMPFLNLSLTPFGNVAYKIHTRSGLAIKKGLRNHLGIIDNDYRNEITVIMYNHSNVGYAYPVKKGDKIAQIEFYRVPSVWMFQVNKLSKSQRGENGFGSSGK